MDSSLALAHSGRHFITAESRLCFPRLLQIMQMAVNEVITFRGRKWAGLAISYGIGGGITNPTGSACVVQKLWFFTDISLLQLFDFSAVTDRGKYAVFSCPLLPGTRECCPGRHHRWTRSNRERAAVAARHRHWRPIRIQRSASQLGESRRERVQLQEHYSVCKVSRYKKMHMCV